MAGPTKSEANVAKAPVQESLSQFLARVLDQLSISAWLPAGTIVLIGLLYGALAANNDDLLGAFRTIASITLPQLVMLVAAVVLLTLATQAFEFEAIQLLEGYWGDRPIARHLAHLRCGMHLRRRERLRKLKDELESRSFALAVQAMLDQGIKRRVVSAIQAEFHGNRPWFLRWSLNEARQYDWRQYAPSADIRRLDNVTDKLADYPEEDHRVLPTRLGNLLRSREEGAYDPTSGSMEGMVIRVYDGLPLAVQHEHDRYRSSLDLYCSMVIVFVIAAVAALPILTHGWKPRLIAVGVCLGLALFSYRAAIASARGYGTALEAVSQV